MWTLIKCFHKIVHHYQWIQRLAILSSLTLIVLGFLNIVQQQRGSKMWPHDAERPKYTLRQLQKLLN